MPNRFLRLPEVQQRVGLSRSSIYLRIAQGKFPKPISLGEHSVAWLEEDVDRWMGERVEAANSRPEPLAGPQQAPASEYRADAAVESIARAGRRGFAARQPVTTARMSTRDGRR